MALLFFFLPKSMWHEFFFAKSTWHYLIWHGASHPKYRQYSIWHGSNHYKINGEDSWHAFIGHTKWKKTEDHIPNFPFHLGFSENTNSILPNTNFKLENKIACNPNWKPQRFKARALTIRDWRALLRLWVRTLSKTLDILLRFKSIKYTLPKFMWL